MSYCYTNYCVSRVVHYEELISMFMVRVPPTRIIITTILQCKLNESHLPHHGRGCRYFKHTSTCGFTVPTVSIVMAR